MAQEKNELSLQALLQGDRAGIKRLYAEVLPGVAHFIRANSGGEDDAKDLLQEAVLVLFKKGKAGGFELRHAAAAYLFGICKKLWLKKLEKTRRSGVTFSGDLELESADDFEDVMVEEERYRLFRAKFRELSESCRTLLELFFKRASMQEIAETLGFASVEYAKKRKFQCKENLVQLIKNDPNFSDLQ